MRGAFDDDDFEQQKSSLDAEITLGAGTMFLLFAGLVVVCGLCFGMGYLFGHRGVVPQAAVSQTDNAPAGSQASSSQPKPSATAQVAVSAPVQPVSQSDNAPIAAANDPSQSSAVTDPVSPAQASKPAPVQSQQVRAALPAAAPAPEPKIINTSRLATTQAQSKIQPAVSPAPVPTAATMWVQIAAVSHVEDAQVLTTALRKRGYTVVPRRETDDLIHVRVGPFTSSDEASLWRTKLLNDGYNAEIQK